MNFEKYVPLQYWTFGKSKEYYAQYNQLREQFKKMQLLNWG